MIIQSLRETRNKAHKFSNEYKNTVKESAESQSFLNDFFNIFGIHRRRVATFERAVRTDNKGVKSIDLLWEGVLLIEMKSQGSNLDKAYQQGKNYFKGLTDGQLPRFVLVCDFNEFRLYDLDNNQDYRFELGDLVNSLHLFDFMNGGDVDEIAEYDLNEKAALLLGKLHDSLEDSNFVGHQLQVFMVRILFCLFAEDTGVFNRHQFVKYLALFTHESGLDTEMHLSKLFQILNKPNHDRNTNLSDELNAFPYVNGDLFKERIDMPSFTSSMREQLLECCHFNWHDISPAIFGSLFQSIMDKDSRRNLGAHYTSEDNILRLIKPLFLDDLQQQLNHIVKLKQQKIRSPT